MEERREQKTIEGFGRIFKPRYTRRSTGGSQQVYENPIWWIAYYHNGEELRESSHSSEEKEAIKLLKRRVQDLGRGIGCASRSLCNRFSDLQPAFQR
jgi:hypothetical protein